MIRALMAAVALAFAGMPIHAQSEALEMRVRAPDQASPEAAIDQMQWLVGQWNGTGIGGASASESWLPPVGTTMVGTFIQATGAGEDGKDGIRFTEHMYLMEEEGTLVLRLKHFNADLTGWEEKDDTTDFRLVAIEGCAAYFHGLTLRCTEGENGEDGLLAAVRMKSKDSEAKELVFRFTRSKPKAGIVRCPDASTTLETNACLAGKSATADTRRAEYLAAALAKNMDRPELAESISASDLAFISYRDAECGAVYEDWIEGSIRNAMAASCMIDMTDERTSRIWQVWLAGMEQSSAPLPQPGPTR